MWRLRGSCNASEVVRWRSRFDTSTASPAPLPPCLGDIAERRDCWEPGRSSPLVARSGPSQGVSTPGASRLTSRPGRHLTEGDTVQDPCAVHDEHACVVEDVSIKSQCVPNGRGLGGQYF